MCREPARACTARHFGFWILDFGLKGRPLRGPRGAGRPLRGSGGVGGLLLAGLLVFMTGCPPAANVAPTSRLEALQRVNDNLSRVSQPVQCNGLVSFKFRDAKNKEHTFVACDAGLAFQAPRSLLFDVRHLGGVMAQFGANAERYWVWTDVPDVRKLWWGEWRRIGAAAPGKLPIPPDALLDALMLRPLPESLEGAQLPVLRMEGDDQRLLFVRLGVDRQPAGLREIRLDPREPYQPLEIIDRLPDGAVAMRAYLSDYRRIGADGPLTPRRYVVYWPESGAEMRLDILKAALRLDLPADVFEFPAGWRGESEQIDAPPGGRAGLEKP